MSEHEFDTSDLDVPSFAVDCHHEWLFELIAMQTDGDLRNGIIRAILAKSDQSSGGYHPTDAQRQHPLVAKARQGGDRSNCADGARP
jgi:hypothetical protein